MEFLAAPLLWGLGAAGLPVLIHLLGRPKPLPHRFPALRFILRSQRSSARALRLKHFLVLALRIAALVFIALALARPICGGPTFSACGVALGAVVAALALWALFSREYAAGALGLLLVLALYLSFPGQAANAPPVLRGDYVLVMDQSMSMSYVEPGGMRFDLARQEALQVLDRLAPDARAGLILATENAERAQGRLTYRHEAVRRKLAEAKATGQGLDLGAALQAAREILLRDHAAGPAAVLLFTDLQANAVNALLAKAPNSAKTNGLASFPLVVVDVASDHASNGAALSASLPAGVAPAETTATVLGKVRPVDKNSPCLVELYVDERRVAQKLLQPQGQDVVDVELEFQSGKAGTHRGRLHLPASDRLPMDQDYFFVYEAGRPPSALVLEAPHALLSPLGGEGGVRGRSTAFFIQAALQPYGQETGPTENGHGRDARGTSGPGMSGLVCVVQAAGELSPEVLSKHRVVILADCGPLSDPSWAALQQWTNDGGGLFVWLGPHTQPPGLRRYGFQEYAKNGGLLPGHIGNQAVLGKPEAIAIAQPEHPLLARLTSGTAGLLRETRVRQLAKITPEAHDPRCSVILQLADGLPLLLEKSYGRGRVVLCAMGPGLESSDLPKHGEAFVTLVLDGVRFLSGGGDELRARLGFPLVLTLPAPPVAGQVLWLKPGTVNPETLRVDTSLRPEAQPGAAQPLAPPVTVIVPPLDVPGVHEFRWGSEHAPAPQIKLVAVNPETGESDLAKASPETAKQAFAAWDASVVRNVSDSPLLGGATAGAGTREATLVLLLALVGMLLAEGFLANRVYHVQTEAEETLVARASSPVAAGESEEQSSSGEMSGEGGSVVRAAGSQVRPSGPRHGGGDGAG